MVAHIGGDSCDGEVETEETHVSSEPVPVVPVLQDGVLAFSSFVCQFQGALLYLFIFLACVKITADQYQD